MMPPLSSTTLVVASPARSDRVCEPAVTVRRRILRREVLPTPTTACVRRLIRSTTVSVSVRRQRLSEQLSCVTTAFEVACATPPSVGDGGPESGTAVVKVWSAPKLVPVALCATRR